MNAIIVKLILLEKGFLKQKKIQAEIHYTKKFHKKKIKNN